MPQLEVTRTYLRLTDPSQLVAASLADPRLRIERVHECPASFFRYLYAEVGRAYHWVDRLAWTDAQLLERLAQPSVQLFLLTCAGTPAGYYELERHPDLSIEIAYFGLLPEFLRRGFGGHLLTDAAQRALDLGASYVWLHTCTLDDPAALPNYLKRGFLPFKREHYSIERVD